MTALDVLESGLPSQHSGQQPLRPQSRRPGEDFDCNRTALLASKP